MSETKTKWAQFAITTAIGVGWNVFDRWAQLQPVFESWLPWVSPIVYVAVGGALGYMVCGVLHKREVAELEKRPTQSEVDELARQLSARDAEIAALRSAKVPTRIDIAKSTLGDEGMRAFRALCAASTYVDGIPSRPLVFSMSDGKLSAIGLSRDLLLLMEEADVIRLSEMDEREVVGSQACETPVDVGCGVTACADFVQFNLAGDATVEVRPVRLTWGTDIYVAEGLYGADLGIASLTSLGRELARECVAQKPPMGMDVYIKDAYSAELRESRHHFRCLTKDGELRTP